MIKSFKIDIQKVNEKIMRSFLFFCFLLFYFFTVIPFPVKAEKLYGKMLDKTYISLGIEGIIFNEGKLDNKYSFGIQGEGNFCLNKYANFNFYTSYFYRDKSSDLRYWILGGPSILLHFNPDKPIDFFVEGGLLYYYHYAKQKNTGTRDSILGYGWFGKAGIEAILGSFSSVRVYTGYLKDEKMNNNALLLGGIVNTCYKQLCVFFKNEYISKFSIFEDSWIFAFEAGIDIKFSMTKIFKKLVD